MEQMVITNNLSSLAMDLPIKTGEKSLFLLKGDLINNLLSSIYIHPQQRNVYGYLIEISSFKGIFSIMRELIETNECFRNHLKNTLKDQYFPFEQIIRFVRNVLNHGTTSGILIKHDDFYIQRDFILSPKIQRVYHLKGSALINLHFTYSKYIPQWTGSTTYGVQIAVDFKHLKSGMQLEKLISWHNLYLLSELCYNLSLLAQKPSISPKKMSDKRNHSHKKI